MRREHFTFNASEAAASFETTWGQRSIHRVLQHLHHETWRWDAIADVEIEPLPLRTVARRLVQWIEINPVLRCRVSKESGLVQTVYGTGTVEALLAAKSEAEHILTPARFAERHGRRECPVTIGLVTDDHVVTRVIVSIEHQAVDRWGGRILVDQLRRLLHEGEPGLQIANGQTLSPIDLAMWEQSAEGQSLHRRSVARILEINGFNTDIPSGLPTSGSTISQTGFVYTLKSHALTVALHRLNRQRITPTSALLFAANLTLQRLFDGRVPVLWLVNSNRYDPRWLNYPGNVAQHSPIAGDRLPGDPDRAMRELAQRVISVCRFGRYDVQAFRAETAGDIFLNVMVEKLEAFAAVSAKASASAGVAESIIDWYESDQKFTEPWNTIDLTLSQEGAILLADVRRNLFDHHATCLLLKGIDYVLCQSAVARDESLVRNFDEWFVRASQYFDL